MNRVSLVGRLTRDPELRYTESGKAVTNFSIACNTGYGEKRTTEYVDCVAWEKQAEAVAERARTGTEVFVDGRLQTRKYTNRDGIEVRKTEVIAGSTVIGMGPSTQANDRPDASDRPSDDAGIRGRLSRPIPVRQGAIVDVDDIPF